MDASTWARRATTASAVPELVARTRFRVAAPCAVSRPATPSVTADKRDHDLALLAKALGHPARVHILRLLLSRDACYCGQLVEELPLAQATVSQHLKVLKEAGLIVGEFDGPRTCYWASREFLGELHDLVGDLVAEAAQLETDGCD